MSGLSQADQSQRKGPCVGRGQSQEPTPQGQHFKGPAPGSNDGLPDFPAAVELEEVDAFRVGGGRQAADRDSTRRCAHHRQSCAGNSTNAVNTFESLEVKLAKSLETVHPKSSSKNRLMDGKTLGRSTSKNTAGNAVWFRTGGDARLGEVSGDVDLDVHLVALEGGRQLERHLGASFESG